MKKVLYTTGLMVAVVMLFITCDHEKLDTFHGKEQVYFSYADTSGQLISQVVDSCIIRLGYDDPMKEDTTLTFRVKIMGMTRDYERPVNFVLVDSLSTAKIGEDIDLILDESRIFGGSIYGLVKVKIKNTEKLADSTMVATIRTVANEHFYADYNLTKFRELNEAGKIKGNEYRIFFHAKKEMPNLWSALASRFTSNFGDFTRVKYEFICETLGLTDAYFTYDPETENPMDLWNVRFGPFSMAWTLAINRALNKFEDEHGYRLKDENGDEVKLPLDSIN